MINFQKMQAAWLRLSMSIHNWSVGRKGGHRYRIKSAGKTIQKISDIRGRDNGETFARRIGYLRNIDPMVFEEMVLDAFQRDGYTIQRNARYTGDGGLDGRVHMDGGWWAIQCKRYRNAVHTEHIYNLREDALRVGCIGGVFVHTGKTPKGAKYAAQGITVISGKRLTDWLSGEAKLR